MSTLKPPQQFDESQLDPGPPDTEETRLQPASEWDDPLWQEAPPQRAATKRPKRRHRLLGLFLLLLLILVVMESGWSLYEAWLRGPLWFGLYAGVIGGASLLLGRWGWREWHRLGQLKRAERQREQAKRMEQGSQRGEAEAWLDTLAQSLPEAYHPARERWLACRQGYHDDGESLLLYERTVLAEQDRAAEACIYRYAGQASLLLAASPVAILDMALMLWRNQAMLDEVARIYGIEPGYWGRVRLLRGILVNLLYAGGSELAVDLGTQMLSAELTGKLSARVAQGLGAGLLTARLGYAACALCRPLPYRARHRPALLTVQGKLLAQLTRVSADAIRHARDLKRRNEEFTKKGEGD
ncbi:TIGR01620 family protein [Ferrimonas gelatinilytica]|uniref:TIGR01620 family protein n=1 Tax=Ferrimonas gelatinilytica TaxID=1255257 RepID=A0ABP9RT06_9GAMM